MSHEGCSVNASETKQMYVFSVLTLTCGMNWLDVDNDFKKKNMRRDASQLLFFMTCIKCTHDIQSIDVIAYSSAWMPFCKHFSLYTVMCPYRNMLCNSSLAWIERLFNSSQRQTHVQGKHTSCWILCNFNLNDNFEANRESPQNSFLKATTQEMR